ncbi:MAG: tRNA(His) guanylyltransferase Thg1 family protein [Spirochaetales bacterium]
MGYSGEYSRYEQRFAKNEEKTDVVLAGTDFIVVRVDGVKFSSKYLKNAGLKYDPIYLKAMVDTAIAIMKKYEDVLMSYTFADEISFLLRGDEETKNDGNRVQKLTSKFASMATLFLVDELQKNINGSSNYDELIKNCIFAGKSFNVASGDLNKYFYWRQLGSKQARLDYKLEIANETALQKLGTFIVKSGKDYRLKPNTDLSKFILMVNGAKIDFIKKPFNKKTKKVTKK